MSTYSSNKAEYNRNYYQRRAQDPKYKAERAAYAAEYRAKNPDKIKKHRKDAYHRDTEKYKAKTRNERLANLEYVRERERNSLARSPWGLMCSVSKRVSKEKNLPHNLTPDYIKSIWPADNKCPVFGTEFQKARRGESRDCSASLDRIIPELGYVEGNVIVISLKANRMKNNGTLEELRLLANFYEGLFQTRLLK